MFGVVPKSIWNKINPSDENNMCSWALRCLLIEDGNRLILVDNGMGDKQDAKFFSYYYLHGDDNLDKSLARYGFHRDDITDVFLTHLHFDHCGGSINRDGDLAAGQAGKLVPAFTNATYWSNERHWETATKPNEREKASFLKENVFPIKESGQLRMVSGEWSIVNGRLPDILSEIIPGLSLRIVNGHTEAMMVPQIKYKNKTVVFVADLLPSHGHIPIPYIMAYDMQPLVTLNEKKFFLNETLENNYILFFEHDPQYECCTIHQTERGIRPKDFFKLDEI